MYTMCFLRFWKQSFDKDFFSETDYVSEQMKKVLKHPDYFRVAELFTVEDLFNARVHLGHTEGSLDERMSQFVFGSRLGHLIIDLDQTAVLLRDALNFTAHIAFRGGIILFIGRTPQHQVCINYMILRSLKYSFSICILLIFTIQVHEYQDSFSNNAL